MPKRILDSSMLSSPSLAKCSPRAQDAWPRFLLLMDDFGCEDANPRRLLGAGWPLRDDVTERDVWSWLEEYVAAGMACLWTEKERRWVVLTGWFGAHGQRRRVEYDGSTVAGQRGSKRKTPPPPGELVAAILAGVRRDHDGRPPGVDRETQLPARESEFPAADPPREATSENVNDSVPAREIQVPARENTFPAAAPAPAVAVAVAVAHPIHRRARAALVSPYQVGQDPCPATTAVLTGLFDRGLDAAPPSERQAQRVEEAIKASTVAVAVERLAAVYADPNAEKPLTYHVDAIRGRDAKPKRPTHGDLGTDLNPWTSRLTDEEKREARAELEAITGDEGFPVGMPGSPEVHDTAAIARVNEKWKQIAEART